MRRDKSSGNPLLRFHLNAGAYRIRGALDRINAEHRRAASAVAVRLVSPSIGELCLRMVNQSERGHGPVPNGPALEPRTDRLRANVNAVAPMKIAGRFRSCWISSRRFGGMVAGDRGHRVIGLITLSGMTRFVQWKTELEQEETVGADIYYRPEAIVSRSVAALWSGARSLATSQLLHWYRPPRSWPCQPRDFRCTPALSSDSGLRAL